MQKQFIGEKTAFLTNLAKAVKDPQAKMNFGKIQNTYAWFMLRFDRKQQSSVKQLSFN